MTTETLGSESEEIRAAAVQRFKETIKMTELLIGEVRRRIRAPFLPENERSGLFKYLVLLQTMKRECRQAVEKLLKEQIPKKRADLKLLI